MRTTQTETSSIGPTENAGEARRDGDLLRQYAERRSEAAFAELGRRYAGLVYATCWRETGERTLAEDATQGVFLLLSQKAKARHLQGCDTLAGWLYTASRYVSKNLLKQERRRKMREASALLETTPDLERNPLWERVEPHFHDALNRLKPADREAVLLRFVQEMSLGEVGARLGVSENTARMRVNRALERIRTHLGKVGVAVTVLALAETLETRAAQAAPTRIYEALARLAAGSQAASDSAGRPAPKSAARARPQALVNAVRQAARQMARRPVGFALIGTAATLLLLTGLALLSQRPPAPLSQTEQRRLFATLAGTWKGSLEYADDRSGQHFTYPTTVTFQIQNGGDAVQYTAIYAGSSSVDVSIMARDPATGKITVQNGGAQSSHPLHSVGQLANAGEGVVAFEGYDAARKQETRLQISLSAKRLRLQEAFRRPFWLTGPASAVEAGSRSFGSLLARRLQPAYQFRNRFDLQRQSAPEKP